MNRKISFAPGEFYHIYNRGNDKRHIFLDDSDRKRFTQLLFLCNGDMKIEMRSIKKKLDQGDTLVNFLEKRGETLVDIGAFCLMPNHFHLLLHEKTENGITRLLKKLCTAYAMYFNTKYERVGKLFERAFRAQQADSDEYLKYLFSYIHLNPAKLIDPEWKEKGLKDLEKTRNFVETYQFSSYKSYLDTDDEYDILLNKLAFPSYFVDSDIRKEVEDWLTALPR